MLNGLHQTLQDQKVHQGWVNLNTMHSRVSGVSSTFLAAGGQGKVDGQISCCFQTVFRCNRINSNATHVNSNNHMYTNYGRDKKKISLFCSMSEALFICMQSDQEFSMAVNRINYYACFPLVNLTDTFSA